MSNEELTSVSGHRKVQPEKLGRVICGELDWIVMKALEKDRTRRYESSFALAEDIGRHLRSEAVSAAPPSMAYQFTKLARRYKKAVVTAGMFTAVLVGATIISTWQAYVAIQERKRADEQTAVAEGISEFFNHEILRQASAWRSDSTPFADLTLREVLARVNAKIEGRFPDAPVVEASIRLMLGDSLNSVGRREEALQNFRRSYELFLKER